MNKAVDSIQERLTNYACSLHYESFPPQILHAAKVRIIDTLGALIGGFFAEPCRIARNVAAAMPVADGASVIGTRLKTTPEMAAFVNATAARYLELNDLYLWPGSFGGHPSDCVAPLLATAEYARVNGREFITSIVLSYEVYQRFSDIFHNKGFDQTNLCCLATAVGAGKVLALSRDQLSHCISMAVVPNNMLRQVRMGHLSMFKAAAPGQAGRAGVFSALLARAGMAGPHLPFEGKAGWCAHVAREQLSLGPMGGEGTSFKIPDTQIKLRPANGLTIASILAAEKLAPLNIRAVNKVVVEVHKYAKERVGSGDHTWSPDSRETADHSIPYLVAATLIDGTVTPRSFNDAHLWNPELRALMQKIEVIENEDFTNAYEMLPRQHRMRITVVTSDGERLVGSTEGNQDDLAAPKSDTQIVDKFRTLTEDILSTKQVDVILDYIWHLEDLENVAEIPPAFIFD